MSAVTKMPLGARPRLVNCGLAQHGLHGREEYRLPKLWCLHLFFYAVELEIGRRRFSVIPGVVTVIPPDTKIVFHYGSSRCRHFFVHFRLPQKASPVRVSLFQHLPEAIDELLDRLQHMQAVSIRQLLHAEALLWGVLWDLTGEGKQRPSATRPSLMEQIEEWIEAKLPAALTVGDLARDLGVSPTHVNRVVGKRHGFTAVQLIRKRRLQRAFRLLIHSTMPVKLAAAESGVADLQVFNKMIRKEYGKSPRQIREDHLRKDPDESWAVNRG